MGENLPNWIRPILDWMETTWINDLALGPAWSWPIMETLHFTGMCLLFGPIIIMDLRLIGFDRLALPSAAVHKLSPLTITGFAINLITGIIFIFGNPYRYAMNISFAIKAILILLAGANAIYFWIKAMPILENAGEHEDVPTSIKVVGASSLLLWTGVLATGRLIPYLGTG
ncbi:MAG TPA: DUF6644 family protein [Gammaproteobacteria bacterium]